MDQNRHGSNHLLDSLPLSGRSRLLLYLERVKMTTGEVIHECGSPQTYVYFPIDCVVSLLHILGNGCMAEVAVIGNDGVVGMPIIAGDSVSPHRVLVQGTGHALRMLARDLRKEFERSGVVQQILLRYSQALMIQLGQTSACNRYHRLEQQLCRWLLISIDRRLTNDLTVTHELIAQMLGVRRGGVTEAAGRLQQIGAIRYVPGRITVLDRSKLEALSCECYGVVQKEYLRLLPWEETSQIPIPERLMSIGRSQTGRPAITPALLTRQEADHASMKRSISAGPTPEEGLHQRQLQLAGNRNDGRA